MGWDVNLVDGNGVVAVPKHQEGGVVALGGSDFASMSVTYNYSEFYYEYLDNDEGFRWLNGKLAKNTIQRLEHAVNNLGTVRASDYWASTQGNAGYILGVMLLWAKLHPNAKWEIS